MPFNMLSWLLTLFKYWFFSSLRFSSLSFNLFIATWFDDFYCSRLSMIRFNFSSSWFFRASSFWESRPRSILDPICLIVLCSYSLSSSSLLMRRLYSSSIRCSYISSWTWLFRRNSEFYTFNSSISFYTWIKISSISPFSCINRSCRSSEWELVLLIRYYIFSPICRNLSIICCFLLVFDTSEVRES
jgi:hypothetical protein